MESSIAARRPALPRLQGAGGVREGGRAGRHPLGGTAYRNLPARDDGSIRTIEELGGEYRWQTRVDDIELTPHPMARQRLRLHLNDGSFLRGRSVVPPSATARARTFRDAPRARRAYPRPNPSPSAYASSIRKAGSIRRAMAVARATRILVRRPIASHRCQWPHGLWFLHVCPGGRGRGDIGGRPRRHQWHEPIFARGVQRQLASSSASTRRGIIPDGRLPGLRSSAIGNAGLAKRAAGLMQHGATVGILPARSTALGEVTPSYKPGDDDGPHCLPDFVIEAFMRRYPSSGARSRARDPHPDAVMTGVEATRIPSPSASPDK